MSAPPDKSRFRISAIIAASFLTLSVIAGFLVWSISEEVFKTPKTIERDGIIVVEGPRIANMRDFGSWKTAAGKRIKKGMLYRSAALNYSRRKRFRPRWSIPESSRRYLADTLGIKTDLDMRAHGEETHYMTSSPLGDHIRWIHIPGYPYDEIVTDNGKDAFRNLFKVFLNEDNYPILFHCKRGRDRAGTLAFILGAILDISDADLRRDWEYSERSKDNEEFDYSILNRLILALAEYPGETIHERAESFVCSLGFSKDDVAHFQRIMTEE